MSKATRKVFAGLVALGLTVTLAACTSDTVTPTPSTSGSASASPSEAPASAEDVSAAADTYQKFVDGVLAIDPAKTQALFTELQAEYADETDPTEEVKEEILAKYTSLAPETFALVDMSGLSADERAAVLGTAGSFSLALQGATVSVNVPDEAVTVTGDSAVIDRALIEVDYNQGSSELERPELSEEDLQLLPDVELTKVDGKWLISSTLGLLSEILS